jgi:hypothetical protein
MNRFDFNRSVLKAFFNGFNKQTIKLYLTKSKHIIHLHNNYNVLPSYNFILLLKANNNCCNYMLKSDTQDTLSLTIIYIYVFYKYHCHFGLK